MLDRLTFTKVTMEDIATEVGIARQTIYKYFSGKDDLVIALFVEQMTENHAPELAKLARRVPSAANLGTLILAELSLARGFGLFAGTLDPAVAPRMAELVFHSEALDQTRREIWEPILTRYEDEGVFRAGLDHASAIRWLTYQQFWLLTHPDVLCTSEDDEEYYIREFVVPAMVAR